MNVYKIQSYTNIYKIFVRNLNYLWPILKSQSSDSLIKSINLQEALGTNNNPLK